MVEKAEYSIAVSDISPKGGFVGNIKIESPQCFLRVLLFHQSTDNKISKGKIFR